MLKKSKVTAIAILVINYISNNSSNAPSTRTDSNYPLTTDSDTR